MKQFDKLQKSLRIIVAIVITVGALNLGYMSASQVSVSNDINLVDSNIQTLSTSTYSSGVYIDGREIDSNFITALLAHGSSFWTTGVAPTSASQITAAKLADFKGTFTGTSKGIKDAYGIQYMVNATYMYLHGNEISDISYLAGCTVNWTRLWFGSGTTLGNNISDISSLSLINAEKLNYLYIQNNPITSLDGIESIATTLSHLYANYCEIEDLSVFENRTFSNVYRMELTGNNISDISSLASASFPNLNSFYLGNGSYGNNVSNISALATMSAPTLANLWLDSNPITSLAPLASFDGFTNLTTFYARYGGDDATFDLSAFVGKTFSKLTVLRIEGNNVSDISGLANANFPTLTSLYLGNGTTYGNNISDISALGTMSAPSLTHLYLDSNPITSLAPLANFDGLTNLVQLVARYAGTITSNLDFMAGKTFNNMTGLYLQGNNISNISGLSTASFPVMTTLQLGNSYDVGTEIGNYRGNNISDITPLSTMSAPLLDNLYLDSNPITQSSFDTLINSSKMSTITGLYVRYGGLDINLNAFASKTFSNLTYLSVIGNNISDISGLATTSFPAVTQLLLGYNGPGNNISDISALATMNAQNLLYIGLDNNPIGDFSPLVSCNFPNLEKMFMRSLNLNSLDAFKGLNFPSLYEIVISDNDFPNLAGLGQVESLSSLTNIWFGGNGIEDITGLYTLDSPLSTVVLYNNSISDFQPLMKFDNTITNLYLNNQTIEKTIQYSSNSNGTISFQAPVILVDGSYATYTNLDEFNGSMNPSTGIITLAEGVATTGVVLQIEDTWDVGLTVQAREANPLNGTVTIDFVSEQVKGGYVTQSSSYVPTNGDFSAPSEFYYEGDLVEVSTSPATGYSLSNVTITGDKTDANYSSSVTKVGNSFSFAMPSESVSISVTFAKVSSGGYITVSAGSNGQVFTSSAVHYDTSESVTIQTYPSSGYALDTVTVNSIALNASAISGNSFTFDMPNGNAAISVTFKAVSFGGTITKGSTTGGSFTVPLGTIINFKIRILTFFSLSIPTFFI